MDRPTAPGQWVTCFPTLMPFLLHLVLAEIMFPDPAAPTSLRGASPAALRASGSLLATRVQTGLGQESRRPSVTTLNTYTINLC